MANRTDDSAMTNLRGLMELEGQRQDQETRSHLEAERERTRRAVEERARIEEASRKRALEAEAARMENEQIRRAAEERVEAERMDRELRLRLEAEQKSRAAAQSVELAHRERMAALEASVQRGRGVSGTAAAAIVGAALAIVGVVGFVIHAQNETQAEIARMAHAPAISSAPLPDNSDLQAQLASSRARLQAAQDWIATHPAAAPVPVVNQHPTAPRPHVVHTQTGSEYDHLLEGGTDPVTDTGLEGAAPRPHRR